MYPFRVLGTVVIPDGAIMGDARLWFNRVVSAWTADQAAEMALAALCAEEDVDARLAHWGHDLQIISHPAVLARGAAHRGRD